MSDRRRGLIIGKFYPPTTGHGYLIRAARAQCDDLTVIVCGIREHTIPLDLRAAWLREIHPDVTVLTKTYDGLDENDSPLWARLARQWLGYTPDVVFTSEDYGERWAGYLGCDHVLVDRARAAMPISGTQVRADPFAAWEYLEPCVRAYFVRRICLVGAESTGTTTLAQDLARHYGTVWVPEYGRTYYEQKLRAGDLTWRTEEFNHIATEQARQEDDLARRANRYLFCDTDPLATTIWHRHYLGFASPEVEAIAVARDYPLYLLTNSDIPLVQDGFRDDDLAARQNMHDTFVAELTRRGRRFVLISGAQEERVRAAVGAIEALGMTPVGTAASGESTP